MSAIGAVAVGRSGVRAALLVGVTYLFIGRVFAVPTAHARAWRLAAWLVSGAVFGAHIAYEHFRLRHAPRLLALHTALAVAIGAMAIAVAGMIHDLSTASAIRPTWLIALIAFPAATAVPAFLVALVAGTVLSRVSRRAQA